MRTRRSAFTTPTTLPGSGIALAQMANANLNNPLDRVEGRHEEPRSGPAADPRRGEGSHGSLGDRQRCLQAAEAQPERHRDQEDARPRPLADHRPGLARKLRRPRSTSSSGSSQPSRASRPRSAGRRESSALRRADPRLPVGERCLSVDRRARRSSGRASEAPPAGTAGDPRRGAGRAQPELSKTGNEQRFCHCAR